MRRISGVDETFDFSSLEPFGSAGFQKVLPGTVPDKLLHEELVEAGRRPAEELPSAP